MLHRPISDHYTVLHRMHEHGGARKGNTKAYAYETRNWFTPNVEMGITKMLCKCLFLLLHSRMSLKNSFKFCFSLGNIYMEVKYRPILFFASPYLNIDTRTIFLNVKLNARGIHCDSEGTRFFPITPYCDTGVLLVGFLEPIQGEIDQSTSCYSASRQIDAAQMSHFLAAEFQ